MKETSFYIILFIKKDTKFTHSIQDTYSLMPEKVYILNENMGILVLSLSISFYFIFKFYIKSKSMIIIIDSNLYF